jgi:lipopolysaccharide transport system ATP-binding protein
MTPLTVQDPVRDAERLRDDVVLSVRNVSKKFCKNLRRSMAYGIYDLGRNLVGAPLGSTELRSDEFWALDDINFELRRGEVLGVIGPNGCGKTTLLRLLAGIFPPDRGLISVRGRVGALIAVGAGFHPHMTGRENIYLNGTILGMSRREIDDNFEAIVDFAEMGDFIDAPVSSYSSGMRVRLGFAIAVHVDPEILLIDEVLAVGDVAFREKCMRRMDRIRQSDKAIIFVTHSLYQVEAICSRAMWLEGGRMAMIGPAQNVVAKCLDAQEQKAIAQTRREIEREGLPKSAGLVEGHEELLTIDNVELLNGRGEPAEEVPFGAPLTLRISYHAHKRLKSPLFNLRILYRDRSVLEASMLIDGYGPEWIEGRGVVDCFFPHLALTPKLYKVLLFVRSAEGMADITTMRLCAQFRVTDEALDRIPLRGPMALNHRRQGSPVYFPRQWRFYDSRHRLTDTLESDYDVH